MSRNATSHRISSNSISYQYRTATIRKVNGCELPGGSVLRVEPSDPYHKVNAMASKSDSQLKDHQQMEALASETKESPLKGATAEELGDQKENGNTVSGGNEQEDLDDFFASLE